MNKETLFVAFSTQKGGVGKTALTVLIASYLHYRQGMNIAIVDCDYPQHSIAEMRKRDSDQVMGDDHYKRMAFNQFTELNRKAYPVEESDPTNAIESAQKLIAQSDTHFDIIFFDLPGTLNTQGVVRTLSNMDYIFSPISADRVVLESTLNFASSLNDNIISVGKGNIKGLYLLWNLVDGREKSEHYEAYESVIAELGLPILKTFIPDTKRFRREQNTQHRPIFRSTLFPADNSLIRGSNIDVLSDEILKIITE